MLYLMLYPIRKYNKYAKKSGKKYMRKCIQKYCNNLNIAFFVVKTQMHVIFPAFCS